MTTSIRWFGHATVLIQQGDTVILTDPVLRGRVAHLRRRDPVPAEDWPARLDAVLISHLHWDHLDLPTLRRLGCDKRLLVPMGVGGWLARRGFRHVRELVAGDQEQVEEVTITAVPARHSGRRPPFGPTAAALGYVLTGELRIWFPGDTELFDGMDALADRLDVALVPVWGWGPTLGPGHLDPSGAAEAVRRVRPRLAIPIHWGTFHPIGIARGDAGFLIDPPHQFEAAVARVAPDTEVRILAPGETLTL